MDMETLLYVYRRFFLSVAKPHYLLLRNRSKNHSNKVYNISKVLRGKMKKTQGKR